MELANPFSNEPTHQGPMQLAQLLHLLKTPACLFSCFSHGRKHTPACLMLVTRKHTPQHA
eukprot:1159518-Pelagomonas_calceolata.AAC.1